MMSKQKRTSGIRIRIPNHRVVRLKDAKTGKWLADLRWGVRKTVFIELAEGVKKEIADEP
jgi:hypothetical protein